MTYCVADKRYREDGKLDIYLSVSGHADYAEHGEDIVCSAVSSLCVSLANTISQAGVPGASINVSPGLFVVNAVVEENRKYIEGAFDMALTGMKSISEQYPDHVFFSSGVSH